MEQPRCVTWLGKTINEYELHEARSLNRRRSGVDVWFDALRKVRGGKWVDIPTLGIQQQTHHKTGNMLTAIIDRSDPYQVTGRE
jgi:hypothetical protein